jgi:group II intron reverse transcriptase/maturase
LRPLGIPALEDKLVQAGLVRIMEQIYESAFQDCSYGCRPHRGAHDALRALSLTVESGNIEWIVEADIKGFFDNVKHDWLMTMLEHRIGDPRMLRLIKRFLKAGVFEGGQIHASEEGTPQGGVISPLLANIYLHYALDLWVTKRFTKTCHGPAHLIRYVDDFVVCFGRQEDAERFREELTARLGEFGLEVEPTKTKVLAFGPGAQARALKEGKNKPETFDFLGFTHYCGRTRTGERFRMKRRTARKKYRAKLDAMTEWLRKNRMRYKTREVWAKVCTKLLGHYAYYAVTDNYVALDCYWYEVRRLLHKWLNRRGGKRRLNWEKFERMERRFPIPRPHIRVDLLRQAVKPEQCYLFNF